jgi:hypothetical protein
MTDAAGNATLWLFPTHDPPHWGLYTITAAPPDGSPFAIFNVQNVTVNGDKELFVVLQFAHEPPVTTIAVSPQATNGLYPDPVTVTLSALAAQGYTVQSTQFSIDGGAAQMYSGPFTVSGGGQHTIQYWSVDNTGVFDLAKTLTIQLAQAGGKVTGGGTVENNGVRATFGFTAKSGEPGSLTYVEHRKGATVQLKAAEISSVSVNGNTAVITGGATLNGSSGYSFRLTAVDNGEPGRSDSFGLEVRDADGAIVAGLTFGPVTLSGGNIQIHK